MIKTAASRGSFGSVKDLVEKIDSFVQHYNRSHRPFAWTATADSILEKITRLCSSISGTRHQLIVRLELRALRNAIG